MPPATRHSLRQTPHVQEQRYGDAAALYEPLVRAAGDDLLSVQPVVLANLCVCHILTGGNRVAEALMQRVEEAEEHALNKVR